MTYNEFLAWLEGYEMSFADGYPGRVEWDMIRSKMTEVEPYGFKETGKTKDGRTLDEVLRKPMPTNPYTQYYQLGGGGGGYSTNIPAPGTWTVTNAIPIQSAALQAQHQTLLAQQNSAAARNSLNLTGGPITVSSTTRMKPKGLFGSIFGAGKASD